MVVSMARTVEKRRFRPIDSPEFRGIDSAPMNMTKRQVREALGFRLDKELAEFFGIGKAAISAWDEDKPIPEGRQWQAHAKRPDRIPEPQPGREAA